MTVFGDVWYLFLRHQRTARRQPIWALINLAYPIFWLVLFSQIFQRTSQLPGFPTHRYVQFLAPGVVMMTVIYGAAFASLGMLLDFRLGVIERYLTTPVNRGAIVLARVLDAAANVTMQAVVVLVASLALGVRIATGPVGGLVVVVTAFLLGLVFAALSCWIAVTSREQEGLVGTVNLLVIPLIFLSTILVPKDFTPTWIGRLVPFNPVTWAVDAARSVSLDRAWHGPLLARDLGLLVVLTVVFAALGIQALLRWARRR
jgi:ABC-2 type transport system permease protein